MNKQKTLGIAVFVTIALLAITTGVVFATGLTQGGSAWSDDYDDDGFGEYWGPMHGGRGRWSSEAEVPPMHDAMVQAVAEATDLSVDALEARIAEGERLFEIALDEGMSEADYYDLMVETRATFLAEAFESGLISEERYQWMLERQEGEPYGRGFGSCHRYDQEDSLMWGAGRQRGRGRNW